MKRILAQTLLASTLILPVTLTAHAAETLTIDPTHSYVLWHINHFGFSNPSGKWMAEGTLILDEVNPQNSKVNVTINTANITTGISKLDEHLKEKDFFDTKQFPTATFVSNKVNKTGEKTANVQGILTVHGISKPITLAVTLNKIAESPITHKKTAGFSASTEIKRSEFGIEKYLPGLGDEVKINIEAEAAVS